jgi:hypothetical protein
LAVGGDLDGELDFSCIILMVARPELIQQELGLVKCVTADWLIIDYDPS